MPVRGSRAAGAKAEKAKPSPDVPVRGSQRLRKKQDDEEVRRLEEEEEEEKAVSSDNEGDAVNSSEDSDDGGGPASVDSDEEIASSEESDNDATAEESDSDLDTPLSRLVGPVRPRGRGGAARGGAVRQPPKAKAAPSALANTDLFSVIKEGRYAFKMTAGDWMDDYKADKGVALTKLIQFLVRSSGCKAEVTQEMAVSHNYDQTFKKLTQDFEEDSADYPLIMSGPVWKKFKMNFVEFLDSLIQQCRHTLLYDGFFLEHLLPWLMTMTTSQVQAFRHTSALAAMKLCTSFIKVAVNIRLDLDNAERLLEVERQKANNRRTADRIKVLEGQLDEKKDQVGDLEEHMQKIFSGVFVMRYRDTLADIRSLCIHEIGEWIMGYSSTFLADNYLKYIGWMLYDQAGEVRMAALVVLERLYKKESFHPHLDLFTHKFKDRVVEMVMDVDGQAGSRAVHVACALLDMDILDDENCEQIYQLVFVRPRAIALAAGEFLVKFLFNAERLAARMQEEQEASQQSSPKKKRGKKSAMSEAQFKLKELAKFFLECQAATTTEYFVDSILPHLEELKDWPAYTSLLQDDLGLSTEEEECLIGMMAVTIKRAVGGQGPPFRAARKVLSKKDRLALEEQKSEVSSHFMACLPALLNKYDADAVKAVQLIGIPESFDLALYSELRLQKQLSDFLSAAHRIVFKHSSEDVFEAVARTVVFLQQDDHPLQSNVDVALESLLDAVGAETKEAHSQFMSKKKRSEQDTFALTVHLRRVGVFSRFVDMSKWDLFNALQSVLAIGCDDPDTIGDDLLVACLHSISAGLVQLLKSIPEQDTSKDLKSTIRTLRSHLQEFISRCDELISYSSPEVQMKAFILMSNVLMVCYSLKFNKDGHLSGLWVDVDAARQDRCREFIVANVLLYKDDAEPEQGEDDEDTDLEAQEERSERLVNRREALAAYCKLVAFGMFHLKLAAPVLAYYIQCFPDYGDIIKVLLAKLREFNHVECAKVMLRALQQLFEESRLDSDSDVVDRQSKSWSGIKELAKRFSLSVGLDASRTMVREMMGTIHRDGIVYGLSSVQAMSQDVSTAADPNLPPNLDFFDILAEFLFRLHPTDRNNSPNSILSFLDDQLKDASSVPENILTQIKMTKWQSLYRYRSGLSGKPATTAAAAAAAAAASTVAAPSASDRILDDSDDNADDAEEPAAKRKSTGRSRKPSTSSRTGGMVTAAKKKAATDNVWLQRPSEAEVRQQKLEKARANAARARSGQSRSSSSTSARGGRGGRGARAAASQQQKQRSSSTSSSSSSNKRQHESSPSASELESDAAPEEEEEEVEEIEESEDVQKSSQASWLSSQPKRRKPDVRRSYGGDADRSRTSFRGSTSAAPPDIVESSSPVRTTVQAKRARRVAKPLPENIFDDAMGGDNSDSSEELVEGIF